MPGEPSSKLGPNHVPIIALMCCASFILRFYMLQSLGTFMRLQVILYTRIHMVRRSKLSARPGGNALYALLLLDGVILPRGAADRASPTRLLHILTCLNQLSRDPTGAERFPDHSVGPSEAHGVKEAQHLVLPVSLETTHVSTSSKELNHDQIALPLLPRAL
jgi:hypothetical protein